MTPEQMKTRTKGFALAIIKLMNELPESRASKVIGQQLLRSSTSVGANYRAACRARSHADFIAKLGIVHEEADETAYWLELLTEAEIIPVSCTNVLLNEVNEIIAIIVSSIKTARKKSSLAK